MITITAAAIFASLSVTARADFYRVTDRNDDPGALDVRVTTAGHHDGRLRHKVRTYDSWRARDLKGATNWIAVWFSTDDPTDNEGSERLLLVDYRKGGGLVARMYSEWQERLTSVGKARVSRLDRSTVRVTFPRRLLGRDVRHYRWFVETSLQSQACGDDRLDSHTAIGYGNCLDWTRTSRH